MTRDERGQKQLAFFIEAFRVELTKHLGRIEASRKVQEFIEEAAKIGKVAPATNNVDDLC